MVHSLKIHGKNLTWPHFKGMNCVVQSLKKLARGRAMTSSGNEPNSSFPEEVTVRPDTASVTSSGNEL